MKNKLVKGNPSKSFAMEQGLSYCGDEWEAPAMKKTNSAESAKKSETGESGNDYLDQLLHEEGAGFVSDGSSSMD